MRSITNSTCFVLACICAGFSVQELNAQVRTQQSSSGVSQNAGTYFENAYSAGGERGSTRVMYQEPSAGQHVPSANDQNSIISSAPQPFQVTPETPAASNDQNFFSGYPPVQDLSDLSPGNFSNTKYKWYGFVRLDGIYDFKPIGSTDDLVTSTIPVPQGEGQNAVLNPRYSRIGFDTETPWESRDWTIKTRIELDFFNGNTSGAFGSFPLRMRFAWVDFGPFLIGQAASLFMDYDVFPNVLDYEGPPGMVLVRQPIAAVRIPTGCNSKLAMGVEQPYSDIQWFDGANWVVNPGTGIITGAGVAKNVQDLPDFTSNWRYTGTNGHMQVAGIARKLTYQPAAGIATDELGYGANFTGSWHPWASLMGCTNTANRSPVEKSRFLGQYATGRGINRYLQDVNGLGLDATFDAANGLQPIPSTGWFLSYENWWTQKWISVFSYGESNSDLTATLPGNTYKAATYLSANLIWLPVERMGVGMEYLYGTRENKDGQSGEADRVQMSFQYKF